MKTTFQSIISATTGVLPFVISVNFILFIPATAQAHTIQVPTDFIPRDSERFFSEGREILDREIQVLLDQTLTLPASTLEIDEDLQPQTEEYLQEYLQERENFQSDPNCDLKIENYTSSLSENLKIVLVGCC